MRFRLVFATGVVGVLGGLGLPAADLVLCRDLLIHLSLRDVFQVLAAVVASGAGWLLTSHFAARDGNPEIESGDFRPVNLCREPFNLTEPQEVIAGFFRSTPAASNTARRAAGDYSAAAAR